MSKQTRTLEIPVKQDYQVPEVLITKIHINKDDNTILELSRKRNDIVSDIKKVNIDKIEQLEILRGSLNDQFESQQNQTNTATGSQKVEDALLKDFIDYLQQINKSI